MQIRLRKFRTRPWSTNRKLTSWSARWLNKESPWGRRCRKCRKCLRSYRWGSLPRCCSSSTRPNSSRDMSTKPSTTARLPRSIKRSTKKRRKMPMLWRLISASRISPISMKIHSSVEKSTIFYSLTIPSAAGTFPLPIQLRLEGWG